MHALTNPVVPIFAGSYLIFVLLTSLLIGSWCEYAWLLV